MKIKALIIAQHNNKNLSASNFCVLTAVKEIIANRGTATNPSHSADGEQDSAFASSDGSSSHLLIAGHNISDDVKSQAANLPIDEVIVTDDVCYENYLAENLSQLIENLVQELQPTHIIAAANTFGKDFMPRLAGSLGVCQISDVIEVVDAVTFKRPIYAGNAVATYQIPQSDGNNMPNILPPIILTIRPSAFEKTQPNESKQATIKEFSYKANYPNIKFIENTDSANNTNTSDKSPIIKKDLATADIVISGGKGFGSKENFAMLEEIANKLGAAIGASRAAVDAGYAPNDMQVGQTGKIIAPDIYIAIGISGAIQHIAGMKDAKLVFAINNDENAPIFDNADYGLVADLFEILPKIANL